MLQLVTAPAAEPCTKAEAAAEARLTIAADQTRIEGLIPAARAEIERLVTRALITQTWDLVLAAFPSGRIDLPLPPLQSVTSITYVDPDGDTVTLDSGEYAVVIPSGPYAQLGYIEPAYGKAWPSIRGGTSSEVTVRFVCGYGDTSADLPPALKLAVQRRAAEIYDGRELDPATEGLLEPFRIWAVA